MLSPVLDSLETTDLSSRCIFQFDVSVFGVLLVPFSKLHRGSNFFVVQSRLSVVPSPIMLVMNQARGFVAVGFDFRGLIVGSLC
jgi:hypothetical protein